MMAKLFEITAIIIVLRASTTDAQPTWAEKDAPSCVSHSARVEGRLRRLEQQNQQLLDAMQQQTALLASTFSRQHGESFSCLILREYLPQFQAARAGSNLPRSCSEIFQSGQNKSGVYVLQLYRAGFRAIEVFCDMETSGGPWIVNNSH
jgi:hypothetical protein